MKLLFLYIENFRVYKNCSFNFDSNERFVYTNRTLSFVRDSKVEVPTGFFHLSQSHATRGAFAVTSRVDCVSAVIGENGSGKTSLAEMLNHAFSRGTTEERFIYICKIDGKYICRENLAGRININPIIEEVGRENVDYLHFDKEITPPDLGMIYYSPYYTPRDDWFIGTSDGFIDLSTVGKMARKMPKEYDLDELNTIDRFIMKLASRRKSIRRDSPIPCPGKLTIRVNQGFIDSTQREVDAAIKEYVSSERKGAVSYDKLFRLACTRRISNKFMSEFEYMQALACIAMVLRWLRTEDLILQIIAGFIASCLRNVGYGYEEFSCNRVCKKLVKMTDKILKLVQKASKEKRSDGRDIVEAVSVYKMWETLDDNARRRIRGAIIETVITEFAPYSTVGKSANVDGNFTENSSRNRSICRFGSFLRDVCMLSEGHQSQDGEITLSLLTAKDRDLYLGIKYAYEALQRDLFLKDSGSFIEFSAVGMSSGERAYLSLLGRIDECIGTKSVYRRGAIKNWILFLDEAETALHPAWQRQLVKNAIWYIETFTRRLSVHIIFASHSPTLLSDMPRGNVVHLRRGEGGASLGQLDMQTFGANIFDLYRLAFNQEDGPLGAFAKYKIDKALKKVAEVVTEKRLNYNLDQEEEDNPYRLDGDTEAVLNLIGDPLIKRYLRSLREGGLL